MLLLYKYFMKYFEFYIILLHKFYFFKMHSYYIKTIYKTIYIYIKTKKVYI